MEIHYFSWLRNRVGVSKESVFPPDDVTTPDSLVDWLSRQHGKYAALFTYRGAINISVDGHLVEDWKSQVIHGDARISFFSPIAGG